MPAGLIPDIIDAFPDVKIAGSKVALMYLKGLTNRDFTQHVVKGGDKIELGNGIHGHRTCLQAAANHRIHEMSLMCSMPRNTSHSCVVSAIADALVACQASTDYA